MQDIEAGALRPACRTTGPRARRSRLRVPAPACPRRASPPATPTPAKRPAPTPTHPAGSLFHEPGFDSPPVPVEERLAVLQALANEVAGCRKCTELAETRTQTVFADGSPTARLMFVGEAPGADEDRIGRPFVGRAGSCSPT